MIEGRLYRIYGIYYNILLTMFGFSIKIILEV